MPSPTSMIKNHPLKTGLIAIMVVAVIWLLYCSFNNKEGMENVDNLAIQVMNQDVNTNITPGYPDIGLNEARQGITQNTARGGYKHSSYAQGDRGFNDEMSRLSFFENNVPLGYDGTDGFKPSQEGTAFAPYKSDGAGKLTVEDKFDVSELLPQDSNKDWFDNPHDNVKVRSSHLINIHRPIGVNTVQTSLKNASWDLRGSPPNPKYPVSPWNNSSIEPDTNIQGNRLN